MELEYFIIEKSVKIINIPNRNFKDLTYYFLKYFFIEDCSFITFTKSNDEISIIIDEDKLMDIDKNKIYIDNNIYKVIQIYNYQSSCIDEFGIVSDLSDIFAMNQIPILYINSFNNNYILVPYQDISKVKELFEHKIKLMQY